MQNQAVALVFIALIAIISVAVSWPIQAAITPPAL
jgi:hypothetical protein